MDYTKFMVLGTDFFSQKVEPAQEFLKFFFGFPNLDGYMNQVPNWGKDNIW